jgi:hypothetical protein
VWQGNVCLFEHRERRTCVKLRPVEACLEERATNALLVAEVTVDHLLLDVMELTLGHVVTWKATGHAGEPHHPTGGAGLVATQGCLSHAGSKVVALGAWFLHLGKLAAVWRWMQTKGSMGFGAVAVFNFGRCGGGAGRQVDKIRAHVCCFA